jgi:hypothetical protein
VAITHASAPDREAEALGRKAVAIRAASAGPAAVVESVERTVASLGGLAIRADNAGIFPRGRRRDRVRRDRVRRAERGRPNGGGSLSGGLNSGEAAAPGPAGRFAGSAQRSNRPRLPPPGTPGPWPPLLSYCE